jgi:hypothetical protein
MKKKLLTLGGILMLSAFSPTVKAQTASLQVIHNCADAATPTVDIYAGSTLLIDNLVFRFASETFTNIPAGTNIVIGVAPGSSTSFTQSLASFTVNFAANSRNIVVADGIYSSTGYNPSSVTAPFTLSTYTAGLAAAPNATTTSLLIHHGSTDAPTVDIVAPFTGANPTIPNILVNNASYPGFSAGYVNLPTANYNVQVRDQFSENVVAEYIAPLSTLGVGGAALTIVASGFLNTSNNSSIPGTSFGLFAATSNSGALIPLPTSTITSTRLQAIHNSADAATTPVDVWLTSATTGTAGILLSDNFSFRTASPFIDVPTAQVVTVSIAPPTSTSVASAIANFTYNLAATSKYQLIASGILSGTGYTPNASIAPFTLIANASVRERALNAINTDVLVFHGATDAPAVNVVAQGSGTVVSNMAYGTYNSAGYLQLPSNTSAGNYTLHVTDVAGTTTVASYLAPLNSLGLTGSAITVLASGFLVPGNNSNVPGSGFGLWTALPAGGNLVQLPLFTPAPSPTASLQIIHNCADAATPTVDIYAGGALLVDDLQFRFSSQTFTNIPAGTNIVIGVAPGTSTGVAQSLATFTVNFAPNTLNIVVADGIYSSTGYNPSSVTAPFTLSTYTAGLAAAPNATTTSLLIHHGSTDAPTVDIVAPFTGTNPTSPNILVNNASYPGFSAGYVNLPTADYNVQVRNQFAEDVVAEYIAPLQTLGVGGAALTVIASGFLNQGNNSGGSAFGLYVATPLAGSLIPLPTSTITSTRLQAIHNSADAATTPVDVWLTSAKTGTAAIRLIDNFTFRTASPFIDVPTAQVVTLSIAPPTSTSVASAIANFTYNLAATSKYQLIASGILSGTGYTPGASTVPFTLIANASVRERALNTINTDVLVFHGATDAPAVNVVAQGSGTIVSNMAYGTYNSAGYLQLATNTSAGNFTLHVTDVVGTTTVASYLAPLNSLGLTGSAITVLASGFLTPGNNSTGPAFGLWAALPTGGNLVQLPSLTITSLGEQTKLNDLVSVYPNPFNSQLSVRNGSASDLKINVLDVTGKTIISQQSNSEVIELNTAELSNGIYFVRIMSGDLVATYKIVK